MTAREKMREERRRSSVNQVICLVGKEVAAFVCYKYESQIKAAMESAHLEQCGRVGKNGERWVKAIVVSISSVS
jgi:hypothetical protein